MGANSFSTWLRMPFVPWESLLDAFTIPCVVSPATVAFGERLVFAAVRYPAILTVSPGNLMVSTSLSAAHCFEQSTSGDTLFRAASLSA